MLASDTSSAMQENRERGELGVQRMLAQSGTGVFQARGVGDPENNKTESVPAAVGMKP